MLRLCFLLTLLPLAVAAQDYSGLEIHERPLSGGIENGIPGLVPGVRARGPNKYFVAVYNRTTIDRTLPTHVIVTGHGGTAGTLFQNVSTGRARRYAELFPGHQIILITVNELDDEQNRVKLESWGYTVVAARYSMLSVGRMLDEIKTLKKIASFDLYSHANETNGAALDADFLSHTSYAVRILKNLFTANAWATIHGCNSGWSVAPALAEFWGIPVSGSFTGTHFQRLHSAGDFYPYDTTLAPAGPFAIENPLSFAQPVTCQAGGCMRMHPDPYRYWGEWGIATHGLGFLRYFCGPIGPEDCERRMALSLLGVVAKVNLTPFSTEEDFLAVVKEYMCPINRDFPVRLDCEHGVDMALLSGDLWYTPFLGKSSVCDAQRCWEPQLGETSTAFMDSVRAFQRGFKTLQQKSGASAFGP